MCSNLPFSLKDYSMMRQKLFILLYKGHALTKNGELMPGFRWISSAYHITACSVTFYHASFIAQNAFLAGNGAVKFYGKRIWFGGGGHFEYRSYRLRKELRQLKVQRKD